MIIVIREIETVLIRKRAIRIVPQLLVILMVMIRSSQSFFLGRVNSFNLNRSR
jgi:hypothetical protein